MNLFKRPLLEDEYHKMVKFSNGKYGVRDTCTYSCRYYDLSMFCEDMKWPVGDLYFKDTQGSYWQAKRRFKKLKDKYVKEIA